jgi:uncharacterized protein involved in exopolysaccharide biosynthesis
MTMQQNETIEDIINLAELITAFKLYKYRILWQSILLTFAISVLSFIPKNTYLAEAILSPAQSEDGGSLASLAGQFGGIASLAGINLGGGDSLTQAALATLLSKEFINSFIKEENIKPIMFSGKWDKDNSKWKQPGTLSRIRYFLENIRANNTLDSNILTGEPSDSKAYRVFTKKHFKVTEDASTGFIKIQIYSKNPANTVEWTNKIIFKINEHYRTIKKQEAEKSIQYLEQQLKQTSVVGTKQAIYSLMENQFQTIMLTSIKDEFVFEVIDPPIQPEEHIKPKRLLISIAAFFVTLIAIYTLNLFRHPPVSG